MDSLSGSLTPHATMRGVLGGREHLRGGLGIGGGTTDYEELENKPAINGVELIGDQSGHDLGLAELSDIPQVVDYSTNEVNTGIKWIDGKDIYQKVYHISQPSGAGFHLISNEMLSYVDTVISMTGLADYRQYGQQIYFYNIPYCAGNSTAQFTYDYTGLFFNVTNDNFINYDIYCVFRYTKL